MTEDARIPALDPRCDRQLGDDGLFVLWRDAEGAGGREGLAFVLSPYPEARRPSRLVALDGFPIASAPEAGAVLLGNPEGVRLVPPGQSSAPTQEILRPDLEVVVDPWSGVTHEHPGRREEADASLAEWLDSELDGELLDVLHRYSARALGEPPEHPRADFDLDSVEPTFLTSFERVFAGARPDHYVLDECVYSAELLICPNPACTCRKLRVEFFDTPRSEASLVGSVLVDLGRAAGSEVAEMAALKGAPRHLVTELWACFEERHRVREYLDDRRTRFKAACRARWKGAGTGPRDARRDRSPGLEPGPRLERRPARPPRRPGRNAPCPCGSGRKFKKCCLGRTDAFPLTTAEAKWPRR